MEEHNRCKGRAFDNYKRITNADRIRAMNDEELLDFLCSIETYDDGSAKIIEGGYALCSVTDVEKWLKSEVDDNSKNENDYCASRAECKVLDSDYEAEESSVFDSKD